MTIFKILSNVPFPHWSERLGSNIKLGNGELFPHLHKFKDLEVQRCPVPFRVPFRIPNAQLAVIPDAGHFDVRDQGIQFSSK